MTELSRRNPRALQTGTPEKLAYFAAAQGPRTGAAVVLPSSSAVWKRLCLICLVGWLVRLVVVELLYRSFLAPERDHWEFGYEMGQIARALATGHGFSDPFWSASGPTAMLTPVGPGLIAAFFLLFGVFTRRRCLPTSRATPCSPH